MKYWVAGPSGSGKSHLITLIRSAGLASLTFDLDFLGYRRAEEDWKTWHINPAAFQLLSANASEAESTLVAVGCSSEPEAMKRAAVKSGFLPVMLLPSLIQLTHQRRVRGDSPEKVAAAGEDLDSWAERAGLWDTPVFTTCEEFLSTYRLAFLKKQKG